MQTSEYPPDRSNVRQNSLRSDPNVKFDDEEQLYGTFAEYALHGGPAKVDLLPSIIKEWSEAAKQEAEEVWQIGIADQESETKWKDRMETSQQILGTMKSRIADQGLRSQNGRPDSSTPSASAPAGASNRQDMRIRFAAEDGNVIASQGQRMCSG